MELLLSGPTSIRCLLGRANKWYTEQLDFVSKDGLRYGEAIANWAATLISAYKEPADVALARLQALKYTILDAQQKHEPDEYVYKVVRRTKAAGFSQTLQQLTYAYNGLD